MFQMSQFRRDDMDGDIYIYKESRTCLRVQIF